MAENDLDYAKVTGRFGLTVADGDDAGDNPDIEWCTSGKVRITPLITFTKIAAGSPVPWSAGNSVIEGIIDTEGYLTLNGKRFLWVVDLTSDKVNPKVTANKATHRIEFVNVKAGETSVNFPPATVRITGAGTDGNGKNDLTDLLPVAEGPVQAIYRGEKGDPGEPGPGASDEDIAGYVATPSSATAEALAATFYALIDDALADFEGGGSGAPEDATYTAALRGRAPQKYGVVLDHGAPGTFDAALAEGGMPLAWPGPEGAWAMVYVGYTQNAGSGGGDSQAVEGSVGIAFSDDLIHWTKGGRIFAKNPTPGQPDSGGITGPVAYIEDGTLYLFYIALSTTGYEAGDVTLMLASIPVEEFATALDNPGTAWTRRGTVLGTSNAGSGWRSGRVYHVAMVKREATYYFFVNALDSNRGKEVIGYFTAPAITGPYTADDVNSPIVDVTDDSGWERNIVGDPVVDQHPDGSWVMDYYGTDFSTGGNGNGIAVCQDQDFPVGPWVKDGVPYLRPSEAYDEALAHKPQTIRAYGMKFHFYTAVDDTGRRVMALAIDTGNWDPSARGDDWRFMHLVRKAVSDNPTVWISSMTATNDAAGLVVGDNIKAPTAADRAKVFIASTSADSELFIGQAAQKNLYIAWHRHADPDQAVAEIGSYSASNRLNISPAKITVGRTGGTLGFFGANQAAQPSLTYSRAGETTQQAQIRTALAALGLVADNTTA